MIAKDADAAVFFFAHSADEIIIQHQLRMIAALRGFFNRGLPLGEKTREEYRAFYLRTGDSQFVPGAAEFHSMNFHGRGFAWSFRNNIRTHFAERKNDAVHWAGRESGATHETAVETLAREKSGKEPHRGRGIAAIDFSCRRGEQPLFSMNDEHVGLGVLDLDAESAQGLNGPQAIVAREKSAQDAHTIRERTDDDGAVRDAFVARHRDFRLDARRTFYAKFHTTVLINWFGSRRCASAKIAGARDAHHRIIGGVVQCRALGWGRCAAASERFAHARGRRSTPSLPSVREQGIFSPCKDL